MCTHQCWVGRMKPFLKVVAGMSSKKEQKLSSNDRSQTQDISCYYLYVMKCRAPNINTNVLTKQPLVTNVADDIDGKY